MLGWHQGNDCPDFHSLAAAILVPSVDRERSPNGPHSGRYVPVIDLDNPNSEVGNQTTLGVDCHRVATD